MPSFGLKDVGQDVGERHDIVVLRQRLGFDGEVAEIPIALRVRIDVVGVDTPVGKPSAMSSLECTTDLYDEPCGVVETKQATTDPRRERAFPVRAGRDAGRARLTPEVMDGNDVRVIERAHPLQAGREVADELGSVSSRRTNHLDRRITTKADLGGSVHDGVAPGRFADALVEFPTPRRRRRMTRVGKSRREGSVEVSEFGARCEPKVVAEAVPEPVIHAQRLGLTASCIEGAQQQRVRPLAQG